MRSPRTFLVLAAAVILSMTVAVGPAGASGHTLLPVLDPHAFVAKPVRVVVLVPGTEADLADPNGFASTQFWFAKHLAASPWMKALGSSAEYQFAASQATTSRPIFDPDGEPVIHADTPDTPIMDHVASVAVAQQVAPRDDVRTVWVTEVRCDPGVFIESSFRCGVGFNQPMTGGDLANHPDMLREVLAKLEDYGPRMGKASRSRRCSASSPPTASGSATSGKRRS